MLRKTSSRSCRRYVLPRVILVSFIMCIQEFSRKTLEYEANIRNHTKTAQVNASTPYQRISNRDSQNRAALIHEYEKKLANFAVRDGMHAYVLSDVLAQVERVSLVKLTEEHDQATAVRTAF